MKSNSLLVTRSRAREFGLGALFLAAHASMTILFRGQAEIVSNTFLSIVPLIACRACWRAARTVDAAARPGWIFVAIAMLVWSSGSILGTWVDEVEGASNLVAGAPDFLFFFYGVAILLAATWSEDDALGGTGFCFDGLQAALAGYLGYIAIFNVLPFSHDKIQPIPATLLVSTYDVENAILFCLAFLRLVGRSPSASRWLFDRSILVFTVLYGAAASIYNHLLSSESGVHDIIIDIPFLLFAIIAGGSAPQTRLVSSSRRTLVALLIDSSGPIFFTATVLAFGSIVTCRYRSLGIGSILTSLTIYGLRAALLQSRYLRVQEALGEARDSLERLSLEDSLTGVANRRHLDGALRRCWDQAQRVEQPLSFLLLDVDHFKNLNDHRGHQAGDECLVRVAAALQATITRRTDLVARYGGEEFAVVLPNTDLPGALRVAESIRSAVRALQIPNDTGDGGILTVSIGVSSTERGSYRTADDLVEAADRSLYIAKLAGRDRIIAASARASVAPAVA